MRSLDGTNGVYVRLRDPHERRPRKGVPELLREYAVERAYRDVRGLCIGAGTVEIQRNFIATALLGGSRPTVPGWKTPPA